MSWDKRGIYYYRHVRKGSRVRRVYVGSGTKAVRAAEEDERRRAARQAQVAAERAEKARLSAIHDKSRSFTSAVDLLVKAALLAAGYRQHDRGEWRKRNVRNEVRRRHSQAADPGGVRCARRAG